MRALTVRQPWAWAIIHGGKDVENRTTNVAGGYRGPVAIHAASRYADDFGAALHQVGQLTRGLTRGGIHVWDDDHESKMLGEFVGVVDLADAHEARPQEHAFDDVYQAACCTSPWAEFEYVEVRRLCETEAQRIPCMLHLVLANPRPLEVPIPARGMLGLWTPPADVLEQLQAVV